MDIILVSGSHSDKLVPSLTRKGYNIIQAFQTASEAFVEITNNDIIYFDKLLLLDSVLSAEKDVDLIFDKLGRLFTLGKCKGKEFIIVAKNESTVESFNVHFKNYPNFKLYTTSAYSLKLIEDALLGTEIESNLQQPSQQVSWQPPQPPQQPQQPQQSQQFQPSQQPQQPQQSQQSQPPQSPQQPPQQPPRQPLQQLSQLLQQQRSQSQLLARHVADEEKAKSPLFNRRVKDKSLLADVKEFDEDTLPPPQPIENKRRLVLPKRKSNQDNQEISVDLKQKVIEYLRVSNILNKSVLIAVTGLGGSGKTMIASNLAYAFSCYNVNTCLVDLNIFDRGSNLYFPQVTAEYYSKTTNNFLYKALYKPDEAVAYTLLLNSSLSILSIPFGFDLTKQELENFNSENVKRILANLKTKFNVVLVDISFSLLEKWEDLCLIFDKILMVTRDNVYGISQLCGMYDVNRMENSITRNLFISKVNYVLNFYTGSSVYGNRVITKDNFLQILAESLDMSSVPGVVAGIIPIIPGLDKYLYSDKSLMYKTKEYQMFIDEVILNLGI